MEHRKRVASSKYPKIVVDDEEVDCDVALDKALEEFDESVAKNTKAAKDLSAALRHSSPPPVSEEAARD